MTTPPMFDIRAGSPADHRAHAETVAKALLFPPRDDEGWVQAAPSWEETSCFGAWDGDTCAGSVSQFFVDTTVPGGVQLPTGAVSRVGVLPTHRRRGLATLLMHRLIDDAVERGLALMSLRASEAVIYERYGFGMAGEFASATVTSSRARPVRGAAIGGSFRFLDREAILATVEPIYARSLHRRPGADHPPGVVVAALLPRRAQAGHLVVRGGARGRARCGRRVRALRHRLERCRRSTAARVTCTR